jgi:cell division septum initiation protein DivIVA
MKKAIKDKKKKGPAKKNESIVKEGAEDAAELVMAAKDMVDRLTGWMEDTAEMQSESMLELADAIRDEMGSEQSEAFVNSVKPALESLYAAMETTRTSLTQGVGMLTGEETASDVMGAEEPEADMEPTVDADAEMDAEVPADDDFAAAEPAAGGEEEAGRAKRESVERSRKLGTILSKKK